MALLSCGIPTGYGSAENRAKVQSGDTVVVIGVGGIGTGRHPGSTHQRRGADHCGRPGGVQTEIRTGIRSHAQRLTTEEAADLLRDLTRGVMADSVVVSPSLISGEDVQAALSLTRKGGTCVLTGMTKQTTSSMSINLQEFILWNKNLVGTVFGSCNPRVDVARFARLYDAGLLQLDEMITSRYRLDDINEGYRDQFNGEIIRGVIDFSLD